MVIGDGEERENLEARGVGAPVRFVGQTYDDRELAELLSVASLLIMPGSVGLTCVLGFSNGLPLVTTDASSTMQTPEFAYVRNGENAVVVERPEAESYAGVIEGLLTDRERMARLSAGAVETAAALSMDRMVDAYVAATQHRPGRRLKRRHVRK
jgi:glycosyltransferase involved in cell wall biosynthesis